MDKKFEEILDDCLDRLSRGETINDCLKRYPDYTKELRPHLMTAQRLDKSFVPSKTGKERGREKLIKAMNAEEKRRPSAIKNIFGRRIVWAPLAVVLALAVIASAIWGVFLPPTEPVYAGTLEVSVTNVQSQPGISSIQVTVSSVEVHREATGWHWWGRWINVIDEEQTFDLVEIKDIERILGEAKIEPGSYDRIRMKVEDVTLVINGKAVVADVPNHMVTLNQPFEVKEKERATIMLNFDASGSIEIGEHGGATFKPKVGMSIRKGQMHQRSPFSD